MASRMDLQNLLKTFVPNVYYQPPESLKLKFPCIVYNLDKIDPEYADNTTYMKSRSYQLILIHSDPDNSIVDSLADLPRCRMSRSPYQSNNLYHFVFSLYF